jgi:hypothetical protein
LHTWFPAVPSPTSCRLRRRRRYWTPRRLLDHLRSRREDRPRQAPPADAPAAARQRGAYLRCIERRERHAARRRVGARPTDQTVPNLPRSRAAGLAVLSPRCFG